MKRVAILAVSLAVYAWDQVIEAIRRFVGTSPSRTGTILYYHAVKPHQRTRFARQMDDLINRARPFSAGTPEAMGSGRRNVAVTFDDGFRSVVDNAVPALLERGIPFTVFVPSGCLGERPSWVRRATHPSWQERILSAAELETLARMPLATIGSHSVTHPNLARTGGASVAYELAASKSRLQAATGTTIDLFSFPHGACTPALIDHAQRAGYRRVFTIEPTTIAGDRAETAMGRVSTDPDDWRAEFLLKIAGAYRWRSLVHRLRHDA